MTGRTRSARNPNCQSNHLEYGVHPDESPHVAHEACCRPAGHYALMAIEEKKNEHKQLKVVDYGSENPPPTDPQAKAKTKPPIWHPLYRCVQEARDIQQAAMDATGEQHMLRGNCPVGVARSHFNL